MVNFLRCELTRAATTQPALPDLLLTAATSEGPRAPQPSNPSQKRATPPSKKSSRNSPKAHSPSTKTRSSSPPTPSSSTAKNSPLSQTPSPTPPSSSTRNRRSSPQKEMKEVSPSRRDRMLIRDLLITLRLSSPDPEARLAATIRAGEQSMQSALPTLKEREPFESSKSVKTAIDESIALIELATPGIDSPAESIRINAAQRLGQMRSAAPSPASRTSEKPKNPPLPSPPSTTPSSASNTGKPSSNGAATSSPVSRPLPS